MLCSAPLCIHAARQGCAVMGAVCCCVLGGRVMGTSGLAQWCYMCRHNPRRVADGLFPDNTRLRQWQQALVATAGWQVL